MLKVKVLFLCFAAVAVSNAADHGEAGEAGEAGAGTDVDAPTGGMDISALIGPFLASLGVDDDVTADLEGALAFMDASTLMSLVVTGAFTDTPGGPVNLQKIIEHPLVQAALVEAGLDINVIASALGIDDFTLGDDTGTPTTSSACTQAPVIVVGLTAMAVLSSIIVA
eukprot:gene15984-32835_t